LKYIFILYLPGHAGHFLSRLFSLGPETVPQLPIDVLKDSVVNTGQPPIIHNRAKYYSFAQGSKCYDNWQDFHHAWADFYQHQLYFHFNQMQNDLFSHMIFSIHPHEFDLMKQDIEQFDSAFYYVDLDGKYQSWVEASQKKLGFLYRPREFNQFDKLKSQYAMQSINLTAMLDSSDGFMTEYLRLCEQMEILPCTDQALALYQDWRSVRFLQ
jgi:hypothetical protein